MCLINRDEADVHVAEFRQEKFGKEPFRRHIKQLQPTENSVLKRLDNLLTRHAWVDGGSLNAPLKQMIHLVFHQGYEGSYNDTNPFFG